MVKYLHEWLEDKKFQKFLSKPQYSEDGDFISLFLTDERCYAVQKSPGVTIYYSINTEDIVGFKISGIHDLLKREIDNANKI